MPVRRTRDRRRINNLTIHQRWHLEVGSSEGPGFADEDEERAAWELHRDDLMAQSVSGTRPHAWWKFEAPVEWPGLNAEAETLFALGELEEAEIEAMRQRLSHVATETKPSFIR